MKLPVVAIVGRPNVGKSSLLNCLAGEPVSIVESTPGVTRDRVSAVVVHEDVTMEVVDTGGIGVVDRDDLSGHIRRQIDEAIRAASLILLVTDVREGLTPLDREVASLLRPRASEIPLLVVANKTDAPRFEPEAAELYALGLGDPIPVSAREGYGRSDLLDRIVAQLGPAGRADREGMEPVMKLAVVGRQNVGKSTFVNALAREERMIVSEVPGTTRDAVDVRFEKDGRELLVIDTAGIKRRRGVKDSIQFYSQVRADRAIRRAEVVLLLLDAGEPITRADKTIAEMIAAAHRVCVIVCNKWDLAAGRITTEEYAAYLEKALPGLHYAPLAFTTAREARNIQSVVDLAQHLWKRAAQRIGTGELNRVLEAIREHHQPRARRSKVPKIFYAAQVGTSPPVFVVFVNEPRFFGSDYRRYIENAIRQALGFEEIPVRVILRRRESLYHD